MNQTNYMPADADPLLDRLADQYAPLRSRIDELVDALARVPEKIDETTIDRAAGFVKQIKAAAAEAEKARKAEGDDFLRLKRTVDGFFNSAAETLKGLAAQVERRMNAYLQAKADEERLRRQEEARKAQEAADAAAAEARRVREEEEAARRREEEAEAARIAALTPQDDPAEALAAQRAAAELAERQDNERRERELEALQSAHRARQEAEEAQRHADAKPADLARTRGALGGTATLVTHIEIEITDPAQAVGSLYPYLDDEVLKKAARSLLRAHSATIKAGIARQPSRSHEMPGIRFYETTSARVA